MNVSVNRQGQMPGTRCEIKNLNSVRFMIAAISNSASLSFPSKAHSPPLGSEVHRQIDILDSGEIVSQETRGFNEDTGETFTLRSKEDAPDYRYMPDPNLPPLLLTPVRNLALALTPRLSAHLLYARSASHRFAMRCQHLPMRLENVYRFAG